MQSSSRNGAKVRLLAVHTTEGITVAAKLRDFFNRAGATGSCHASADDTGALLGPAQGFVAYDRAAWTLRNGNPVSDNIELCAFAKWTRAEWLAKPKLLEACATWLAERSRARGVPLVKLSPADVKAGKSGVIGHVDWTQGMGDGTHWDPGPGFPWDVVLTRANALLNPAPVQEDDMPLNDADLAKIRAIVDSAVANREIGDGKHWWEIALQSFRDSKVTAKIAADVAAIRAKLGA